MNTIPFLRLLASAAVILTAPPALAGDFHFRPATIPANEARLMELARVREFRGDYELGEFCQGTLLIAELHAEGQPTKTFRLARAKYGTDKKNRTGILSFGWHRDAHQLVSLNDNGEAYSPWTAKIDLPEFAPFDAYWFETSAPEDRKPAENGHGSFQLYPVMGLCGDRSAQVRYTNVKTAEDFVKACKAAGAKNSVVIYLFMSPYDAEPSMTFENQ